MLPKIALGNVRKSLRDFSVFFITLVFGVCVFYAFASINDQTAVIDLNELQSEAVATVTRMLSGVSVFVAVILGFLVVYANRFLVRRRKREFGIYLTLGMGRAQVAAIMVMETLAVGVAALVVGLALGVLLSQVMMYVTANLFEATIPALPLSSRRGRRSLRWRALRSYLPCRSCSMCARSPATSSSTSSTRTRSVRRSR